MKIIKITIDGKITILKFREKYAQKEKVIQSKRIYDRKKMNKEGQ